MWEGTYNLKIPDWAYPPLAFAAGYAMCMGTHHAESYFAWECILAGLVPLGFQQGEQFRQTGGGAVGAMVRGFKKRPAPEWPSAVSGRKMADECLAKCAPDEPMFVLRAQDQTADYYVEEWAGEHALRLGDSHPKITNARRIAIAMRAWRPRKQPD